MAGWTDYLPDWSSKDKLRLCSVYDALSALVAAVNERGSVLSSYTPLPTVNMLYPVKYYVDLIDSTIKSIVPQFVNHTINGGDFTGLDAIPMWTWSDILNSETEASVDRLYPLLDWGYQRYQIINKLRWTNTVLTAVNSSVASLKTFSTTENINTWANFITICNNKIFTDTSTFFYGSLVVRYDIEFLRYWSIQGQLGQALLKYPNKSIYASVSIYLYAHPYRGYNFQPIQGATLANKMNYIRTIQDNETSDFYPVDFNVFMAENMIPVASGERYTFYGEPYGVLKFTGSNGFQFKDW